MTFKRIILIVLGFVSGFSVTLLFKDIRLYPFQDYLYGAAAILSGFALVLAIKLAFSEEKNK